jgi:copper chaperone CopZ
MTIYPISGMTCMTCVNKIYNTLAEKLGKDAVQVSLMPPVMGIISEQQPDVQILNQWVKVAGSFTIHPALVPSDGKAISATFEETSKSKSETFWPLILIALFLLVFTVFFPVIQFHVTLHQAMGLFMGGFFAVFSFFKFLDIRGFVTSFKMYDPLAKWIPGWAWLYPFLELGLGIAYLFNFFPPESALGWLPHALTILVMGTGLMGVTSSVLQKRKIICACLGTVFNLPMTKVTIIEDSIMLVMAVFMFVI